MSAHVKIRHYTHRHFQEALKGQMATTTWEDQCYAAHCQAFQTQETLQIRWRGDKARVKYAIIW